MRECVRACVRACVCVLVFACLCTCVRACYFNIPAIQAMLSSMRTVAVAF